MAEYTKNAKDVADAKEAAEKAAIKAAKTKEFEGWDTTEDDTVTAEEYFKKWYTDNKLTKDSTAEENATYDDDEGAVYLKWVIADTEEKKTDNEIVLDDYLTNEFVYEMDADNATKLKAPKLE